MKEREDGKVVTDLFALYEIGKNYNRQKGLYDDTERNYNMFKGKQWANAKLGDMKPIVKNIIKPIVKYKLSVIRNKSYKIIYTPNAFMTGIEREELDKICESLNKTVSIIWEQQQVDSKMKEALKDSAINSEGAIFLYKDENSIVAEVIDKNNIYYGNENEEEIEKQPYIILAFRQTVEETKEEAIQNGLETEVEKIKSDDEIMEQAGYEEMLEEISPMCLVLMKLWKDDDGKLWSEKATMTATIRKPTEHGQRLYPLAHMTWESEKGSSRGIGEVEFLNDNQLNINKMAMMEAIAVKKNIYPHLIVNKSKIQNTKSLDDVGTRIEISDDNVIDDVKKYVGYLIPPQLSSVGANFEDKLINDTRELAGAGEIASGDIDPEKASGKAIVAVQQAAQQPVTEQVERYQKLNEDVGRIFFDIFQTFYVNGLPVIVEEKTELGEIIERQDKIPHNILMQMEVNTTIEITPTTSFDKFVQEQYLIEVLDKGHIDFEDYVEALAMDSTMPKAKLQEIIKRKKERQAMIDQMQQQMLQEKMQIQGKIQQQENENVVKIDEYREQAKAMNDEAISMLGGANG